VRTLTTRAIPRCTSGGLPIKRRYKKTGVCTFIFTSENPVQDRSTMLHDRAFQFGPKYFDLVRFDSRYRIDFFDSIQFGNLINLPLVHK